MKPAGYENLAQRRPPAYETNDWTGTTGQAELRGRGIAFGRERGAGHGHTAPAARAAAPRRPEADNWQDDMLRMRTRLAELGA
jgi:hypothetical protein